MKLTLSEASTLRKYTDKESIEARYTAIIFGNILKKNIQEKYPNGLSSHSRVSKYPLRNLFEF